MQFNAVAVLSVAGAAGALMSMTGREPPTVLKLAAATSMLLALVHNARGAIEREQAGVVVGAGDSAKAAVNDYDFFMGQFGTWYK